MRTNFNMNATVFFALVFVCYVLCSDVEKRKWQENMKNFRQFRCKKPQLKTIRAQELIGNKMKHFEIVYPHSAVLHRCADDTGCCSNIEATCAAKLSEDITLVFRVHDPVLRTERFETYYGKSHTECSCQKMGDSIK